MSKPRKIHINYSHDTQVNICRYYLGYYTPTFFQSFWQDSAREVNDGTVGSNP